MCGIAGVFGHKEASNLTYLCLYALQHRGQESAGIASSNNGNYFQHKGMGLVSDVFTEKTLKKLEGNKAIGHVRYSTSGETVIQNAQPFIVNSSWGYLALAHNGNLTNANVLRRDLEKDGAIFQSTMDSEVIAHLIAHEKGELPDRIIKALKKVEGAYSLLFLAPEMMIAVRDPLGFRPLCLGKLDNSHIVASESCALDLIDANFLRSIEPGEMIVFKNGEAHSSFPFSKSGKKAHCIFEYVYFARPDSHVFNRDVYSIREGFGRVLAREFPVNADVVIPVPDSGVPAALGYSKESKIPFEMGLMRNHYIGRTFIEPKDSIRHFGVKIKLNPVREILKNKKVVVIDDSIVRGTTSKKIIDMIKKAGAKEVHMRISSPPTMWSCYYGIDTPTRKELIASSKSVEEIRKFIGANSLAYLNQEGLYWFEKLSSKEWFCDACFTGDYPDKLIDYPEIKKLSSECCPFNK